MRNRTSIHTSRRIGERIADLVVGGMGSWRFIIIQSIIVALWIAANLWFLSRPFDAYPFILLNLLFSTQAAYASPLILMSQNRQAEKDRKRDDVESVEVAEMYQSHQLLLHINQQQLEILQRLREIQEVNGNA